MVRTFDITTATACEMPIAGEPSAALPPGAYTTLRTYGHDGVVRLEDHVKRLEDSAAALGRPAAIQEQALRSGLAAAIKAAGHRESRLRVTFAPPRLFVTVEPFEPLPAALYQGGAACITVPVRRDNPQTKDTRFLATARGLYGSLPVGVHEGLLVGPGGALLEGLSSNFFAIREGILHTEPQRALPGITRSLVLEVARGVLPLATTAARVEQLPEVTECFITSASRGVLAVTRIDDTRIGGGRPGGCTRELASGLEALLEREAKPLLG